MNRTFSSTIVLAALIIAPSIPASAGDTSRALYTATLARERAIRDAKTSATLQQMRAVVAKYERLANRFPSSGYSDNALWQGGNLALLAYQRFGEEVDRRTAQRLLARLKTQY